MVRSVLFLSVFISVAGSAGAQRVLVAQDRDSHVHLWVPGATQTRQLLTHFRLEDATEAMANPWLGNLFRNGSLLFKPAGLSIEVSVPRSMKVQYGDSDTTDEWTTKFAFSPFVPISSRYLGIITRFAEEITYGGPPFWVKMFWLIITDLTSLEGVVAIGLTEDSVGGTFELGVPVVIPESGSDTTGDGIVNADDLLKLMQSWHK